MHRLDGERFDWLLAHGCFADLGGGWHALTGRGEAAADLGLYEPTPADALVRVPKRPLRSPGRPRKRS
ncbi:MAG TPA: hypothetical protein VM529_06845 [Gemmata sp.]|nr:hypothetical protein [Gemmata sp.]